MGLNSKVAAASLSNVALYWLMSPPCVIPPILCQRPQLFPNKLLVLESLPERQVLEETKDKTQALAYFTFQSIVYS